MMYEKTVFKQTITITVFWNSTDAAFLSITADFDDVIIFLTVKILNESAIIMIELIILELTVKEQSVDYSILLTAIKYKHAHFMHQNDELVTVNFYSLTNYKQLVFIIF